MARTGKIACLPLEIRSELNRRLDDGQSSKDLLPWLNGLPDVREMLDRKFAGQAINKQNLGAWRTGGHREWQARNEILSETRREMRSETGDLTADAGELAGAVKGRLTDHLATVLTARYASLMMRWNGEVTEEFKGNVRVLGELCRDVSALRRGDHEGARMEIENMKHRTLNTEHRTSNAREGGNADRGLKVEDGKVPKSKVQRPESGAEVAAVQTLREADDGVIDATASSLVKAGQGWSSQTNFFSRRLTRHEK